MTHPWKRREVIGGQVLYLGDSREIVPSLTFDAICTDPPYGIGALMKGGTWAAKEGFKGFQVWDMKAPDWIPDLVASCPAIVWGGNYFPMSPSRCWLIWNKLNAVPTMADFEQAWTNLDRPSKRLDLPVGRMEFGHPTQKPLALMEWCIGFLPDAKTILDPFSGSGTVAVACQRLGRSSISIEIDPDYFDTACRRVEAATRQPDMFITPPPKPQQETLL